MHHRFPRLLTRRSALARVAAMPAAAAGLALAGCANRPVAPTPPPKPIALLAVLPAFSTPSESNAGFGANRPTGYVPIQTGPRGSFSPGGAAAAVGVGLIALAIASSVAESKKKDHEALMAALAQVNFDAVSAIDQHLAAALAQREVRMVRIADAQLAAELRAGRFERLPAGVDALLDIEVSESGFYASSRAGGFSPMMHLSATLRPAAPSEDTLDEFGYYADWRDGGTDKRWLTTPKALTFESLDTLKERAAEARAGLDSIVERLATLMADDLQRRTRGLARID